MAVKKKKDDLDLYYEFLIDTLYKDENIEYTKNFMDAYNGGEVILYQKNQCEKKIFDDEWVSTMESFFPSIDKICRNPRSFIKYEEEIVDVARSKKTNSNSIRHLASHTQYIRDVDKDLKVTPSKILNTYTDIDFLVYENRFIATLILRMYQFIKKRQEIIASNVESFQKDHVVVDSKFNICNDEVTMKIDLNVKRDIEDKTVNEKNYALLGRVDRLLELASGLKNGQFMQTMKGFKPVIPPIMKTNVILKNNDFKNAYTLWLFLDRYSTLGFDIDVKEKDLELDKSFRTDIDELVMVNFATIMANLKARERKYNEVNYKEYEVKKKKKTTKNEADVVDNPEHEQIEDNSLNEYFLTQYKKLFQKNVSEMEKSGEVKHFDAVKKTIKDANSIVNTLFESIFHLEEEFDYFKTLVEKNDIDKEYEIKKNQLRYAKMIREAKQVDYNYYSRLEKKLVKDLEKINSNYLKEKARQLKETEDGKVIAKLELEMKNIEKENKIYEKELKEIGEAESLNKKDISSIKADLDTINENSRKELSEYKEKLKAESKEKIGKLRKNYKDNLKKLNENKKEAQEKSDIHKEYVELKRKEEIDNVLNSLANEKATLQKMYDDKLANEKAEYDANIARIKEEKAQKEKQRKREKAARYALEAYENIQTIKKDIKQLKKAIK